MFKLVIVEDEDNIRRSLECLIPWEEVGFQVVGAFSDGSDALSYLKDNPCDAVLTDILMSRMSGLDMIRELHKIHPQIKVVILSGHSDFAYARQAIEYKVEHYLVKPVDEDELIDIFKDLKTELDEQNKEAENAPIDSEELRTVIEKSFFRDLLSGHLSSERELNAYLKLLDCKSLVDAAVYAYEITASRLVQSCTPSKTDCTIECVIRKVLSEEQTCRSFYYEERNEVWRVLFACPAGGSDDAHQKMCGQIVRRLVEQLNEAFSQDFHFRLTHAVTQLRQLMTEKESGEHTQAHSKTHQMDESLYETILSDYKLLVLEMDLGSKETLLCILNAIVLKLKGVPIEDVQFILKNLYSVVELNYKKRKLNVWDITDGRFNFNHLYRSNDLDAVANCLREDFCTLCNGLKHNKTVSDHNVIGRLVDYLSEHLDEDIPHDVLAAKYRMHPGYLSRLFKQEMGETLSEFLLRIKIEKAAELLKSGHYKVGEIASMVGYSASSYFSIMFKKYTGCSPREYSQRIAP